MNDILQYSLLGVAQDSTLSKRKKKKNWESSLHLYASLDTVHRAQQSPLDKVLFSIQDVVQGSLKDILQYSLLGVAQDSPLSKRKKKI